MTVPDLPDHWRDFPAPQATRDLGSRWLREGRALGLFVPSAVNPQEFNLLLNPSHPDMAALRVLDTNPFHFDPRMWK